MEEIPLEEAKTSVSPCSKTITAQVCGASNVIEYLDKSGTNPQKVQMRKVAIATNNTQATLLIFNSNYFRLIDTAVEKNMDIRISNFKVRAGTLSTNKTSKVSFRKTQFDLSTDEKNSAFISVFSQISPIAASKQPSNLKKRCSIRGTVRKLYPYDASTSRNRRLQLRDASGTTDVVLWDPHLHHEINIGDTLTLYDGRYSEYYGGCIDTSPGSHMEVQNTPTTKETIQGTLVAFGLEGSDEFVTITTAPENVEKNFLLEIHNDSILEKIPCEVTIVVENNLVKDISFV